MEKIVSLDKEGRLYIPRRIRKILRLNTVVLKVHNKSIVIEPIEDDPIKALGILGKEKLKGKSIETLRKEAREDIERHAIKKVRRL